MRTRELHSDPPAHPLDDIEQTVGITDHGVSHEPHIYNMITNIRPRRGSSICIAGHSVTDISCGASQSQQWRPLHEAMQSLTTHH